VYTPCVRPHTGSVAILCLLALTPGGQGTVRASRTEASAAPAPTGAVTISAVVTDRKGQTLAGLKPGDFELLVDGKPQPIDTVQLTSAASPIPRAIAFLLDEFHTPAEDSAAVRTGLLRFVDTRLRPGDLAMVVKPLDPLSGINTTTDRGAIRRAIETFEGRKGDLSPRTMFERNYMAQAPAAVESARAQIVTAALRAISLSLSQKPDLQPAIVLVSDGFGRLRTSRDIPANLQSAVRIANRADAPVYAFAPSIAQPEGGEAPPDPALAALRTLAADTGGEVTSGATELDNGLTRMARDLDARYVLTYQSPHGNDGKFHAIQVAVKRPNAQVRVKNGYVAPVPESLRAASAGVTPSAPLRVIRRSPLIQAWSGTTPAGAGRMNVMLTWEPAVSTSGQRSRASTILVTASAADGTVLFDGAVGPAAEPVSKDVPNHATFDAPSRTVRVDIKVLDARGVVLDTDSRDVTGPAVRPGTPVIYGAAVIRTRSAREFRQASTDPNAAPTPIRDFLRTDRLLIRVAGIDASGAPTPITAVLLNRSRQQMRDVASIQAGPGDVTQFDLPLAGLAPGEYTARLSINGPSGPVTEHVTFRVKG